jgi:hypothetical protein
MQDNGCSITFTQIHLYRFMRDEYIMTYSLWGRMFSQMISMLEIVSDRQTEFIQKILIYKYRINLQFQDSYTVFVKQRL